MIIFNSINANLTSLATNSMHFDQKKCFLKKHFYKK